MVVEEAVVAAANGMEELNVGARRVFVVMLERTPSEEIQLLGYMNRTPPEDLEDKRLREGNRFLIEVSSSAIFRK